MSHRLASEQLVIASHNEGKVVEFRDLLVPYGVDVISAGELKLPEPEETGETFAANAALKAKAACIASGKPSLADDSGLVVPALGGDPGVRSARWGGPNRDFDAAMRRVEDSLEGKTDRSARFVCVLALAWPEDENCDLYKGVVEGELVWPQRGTLGFGYDPVFVATGYSETFGEMDPDVKHGISHRAEAFRKLVADHFSP